MLKVFYIYKCFLLKKDAEYIKMPPLYEFDDYKECKNVYKENMSYCVAFTSIKSNYSIELWNQIEVRFLNRN